MKHRILILLSAILISLVLLQEQIMVYKVTALWIIPFFSALMWKRLQMENGTAVFIKRI